ncbi:MAG: arsenate reductase ArsC [Burkholderiales bacterium]
MKSQTTIYNVLFLCTHNAARSIMAEAILNNLAMGKGRFRAFSAGSAPATQVHRLALEQIQAAGLSSDGLRCKYWREFATPDAPIMHFVFTVCDDAAREVCPVWPGTPLSAHWGVPDPSKVTGSDQVRRRAFSNAFIFLHNRISIFASLPFDQLGRSGLQGKLDTLGSMSHPVQSSDM